MPGTNRLPLEGRIEKLNKIIKGCSHIAFFGGAGVSTASGIPDFRGANGLYSKPDPEFAQYQPEYLLNADCLKFEPAVFYKFYRKNMDMRNYKPNVIHRKLAELEKDGKMSGIITQNIDSLHEDAGSTKIAKIHGTASTCYCTSCGRQYPGEWMFNAEDDDFPRCSCGDTLRPSVVLYNEMLPPGEMHKAYEILEDADCLIICGTSVSLPHITNMIRSYVGTYLVVLNGTPTPFDDHADVTCHEDIFNIFEQICWK